MNRFKLSLALLCGTLSPCLAQEIPEMSTTSCTFQDGKQISVRYDNQSSEDKKALPMGRLWVPGGQPMWLFTQTTLSIDGSEIPLGAYSMYIIPDKEDWILIVNRNVDAHSNYDQHEDLARVRMPLGQLSEPEKDLEVFFGHIAAKQCNMRIYYGKSGAWAEFKEK